MQEPHCKAVVEEARCNPLTSGGSMEEVATRCNRTSKANDILQRGAISTGIKGEAENKRSSIN